MRRIAAGAARHRRHHPASRGRWPQAFAELMQQSMGRGVADAQLRVWAPQGAQVLFVRQVSPTVEDLTGRRQRGQPADRRPIPTGAWGDESRDYHVARAARRQGASARSSSPPACSSRSATTVVAQGLVKATWSDDDALTTRINPEVAHYTGQTELAEAIQEGLAAKAAGDDGDRDHQARPGRPARRARPATTRPPTRLRKVVDIEDAGHRHRAAEARASTRPTRWRSTRRRPRRPAGQRLTR